MDQTTDILDPWITTVEEHKFVSGFPAMTSCICMAYFFQFAQSGVALQRDIVVGCNPAISKKI